MKALIRRMRPTEARTVSALVSEVFRAQIAGDCDADGIATFEDYIEPKAIKGRKRDHQVTVAEIGGEIVAVLEFREQRHVSLLFVAQTHQRQGLGRSLFERTLGRIMTRQPELETVTVNASLNSVPFYTAVGFEPDGGETTIHGIPHQPMRKYLKG